MIAISLHFPSGRYHANPWDRGVNEGAVEWPPSPWRILRALVSVWRRLYPEEPEFAVRPILEKLAPPPIYWLPPATTGHTRHYMPWFKKGPGDRTLVFDAFAVVGDQPIVVMWPDASLTEREEGILRRLLQGLGYLGRAESWCRAELLSDSVEPNCVPLDGVHPAVADAEVARVLAPTLPLDLPGLMVETASLQRRRLPLPPAARWVNYLRPPLQTGTNISPPPRRRAARREILLIRYALDSRVLPLLTDAVDVADRLRQAAMAQFGRANRGSLSPALSGKGPDGKPLSGHRHAHYIPTDEDGDGRLDHIAVWVPGGLDEAEVDALARVHTLQWGNGRYPVWLLLLGHGTPAEVGGKLLGPARAWLSHTPFLLVRHPKLRGPAQAQRLVDGPEDQLRLELRRRGFPEPVQVEALDRCPIRNLSWLEFRRWRPHSRAPGPAYGGAYGFRIVFPEPVQGPISLGYGSHFGLGLFLPESD